MEEDVLDFFADFWEKRLDSEPDSVDNIYSQEQKGLSYASDDFRGFDPVSSWVQALAEEAQPPDTAASSGTGSKRGAKAKSDKRLHLANSKSHNKSILTS